MSQAEKTKASWQDPEVRARRIAGLKAAWPEDRRAQHSERLTGIPRKKRIYSEEQLKIKSKQMSGEGNPFFGKEHSQDTIAKLCRPKGVIDLGISATEYGQKLAAGERWCIGHNQFLPEMEFSHCGYRNGIHRKGARCKLCTRRKWLLKAYNVSMEWYEKTLAEQGGHCFFCPVTEVEEGRPLSIDHDHDTGQARGLACTRCNSALERIEIDGWLRDAIYYLHIHNSSVTKNQLWVEFINAAQLARSMEEMMACGGRLVNPQNPSAGWIKPAAVLDSA